MKNFKITASSQLVSLNSTSENFFQKLSLKYWVLICSTAFAVVSVAIGCFIFVKIKAKRWAFQSIFGGWGGMRDLIWRRVCYMSKVSKNVKSCLTWYMNFYPRKRRRSQNDFKSEMELKEFFDNATKIPSSGYVYRRLP